MSDTTETQILDTIYKALEKKRVLLGKFPDPAEARFKPEDELSAYERLETISNVASGNELAFVNEVFRILAGKTLAALLGKE
jgi:hypothetical protein